MIDRPSVIDRLDQMIGNLFYQGVSPEEIKRMKWAELVYWNGWIELINEEKRKAYESKKG